MSIWGRLGAGNPHPRLPSNPHSRLSGFGGGVHGRHPGTINFGWLGRPLPATNYVQKNNKPGPKPRVEYEEPANCFAVRPGYRRQLDPIISIESEPPERAQKPQFGALCVGHQTVARLASAVMSLSGGKGVQGRGEKSQESPGGRKLDPGGVGDRDGDWNWNRGQGKRGKEDAPLTPSLSVGSPARTGPRRTWLVLPFRRCRDSVVGCCRLSVSSGMGTVSPSKG